jgi:hypothetical protein
MLLPTVLHPYKGNGRDAGTGMHGLYWPSAVMFCLVLFYGVAIPHILFTKW